MSSPQHHQLHQKLMPTAGGVDATKPMTGLDASRIQSAQAKTGGDMSSEGFAARAQRAAAHNEPLEKK